MIQRQGSWDETLHPRHPAGTSQGGEFTFANHPQGPMGAAHDEALASYKNFGFSSVNKFLREGSTGLGPGADADAREMLKKLDAAIAAHEPLQEDIVLYRGVPLPSVKENAERLIGRILDSPAFLSTSTEEATVVERFMSHPDAVGFRFRVPKGTKAATLDRLSDIKEREVLLGRGLRFHVRGVRREHGRVWIDADVVDR